MFSGRGPGNFTADVSWCGDLTTVMHTCSLWYMCYVTVVDSELKHVMGHIIMAHPLQVKGLIKVQKLPLEKMKMSRDIFSCHHVWSTNPTDFTLCLWKKKNQFCAVICLIVFHITMIHYHHMIQSGNDHHMEEWTCQYMTVPRCSLLRGSYWYAFYFWTDSRIQKQQQQKRWFNANVSSSIQFLYVKVCFFLQNMHLAILLLLSHHS